MEAKEQKGGREKLGQEKESRQIQVPFYSLPTANDSNKEVVDTSSAPVPSPSRGVKFSGGGTVREVNERKLLHMFHLQTLAPAAVILVTACGVFCDKVKHVIAVAKVLDPALGPTAVIVTCCSGHCCCPST